MRVRKILYKVFLVFSAIMLGLWVGGTLFHIVVIEPLWSQDPPASLNFFFNQTRFTKTISNFFGPPWMAARLIPLVICILLGWRSSGEHKKYLITAGACWIFITAFTLVYIYPINEIIFFHSGENNSPEMIKELVNKWLFADGFRFVIGFIGYICLLIAMVKTSI